MTFKAYGYNLREVDYTTIKKMGSVVTNEVMDVYDLRSYDPDVRGDDVVFLYGAKAKNKCKGMRARAFLEFPDASRLDPALGESPERLDALQTLLKFKEALDSKRLDAVDSRSDTQQKRVQKLNEELLPELTADKVRELERQQREQGKAEWIGTTRNGKTIRVTAEPDIEQPADVNITFAELYAVIGLMDAFRVKELEIAYKPSSASREDNPK